MLPVDSSSPNSPLQVPIPLPPASNAILSPVQANYKCTTPEQIIALLNGSFDTEDHLPLKSFLQSLISQGSDFGAIYARIRRTWPAQTQRATLDAFLARVSKLEDLGKSFRQIVEESIVGTTIIDPKRIRPRRIWDLRANRVIPYHYIYSSKSSPNPIVDPHSDSFWAISHSWTDDLVMLDTPINGYDWPVPIPSGVDLEDVRAELLQMGAQYVWLDVLCLRQVSPDPAREEKRRLEWQVDLPTIGLIFHHCASRVVRYMNGLGRPFRSFGWDHPKHWLSRAWTLQEVKHDSIIGGVQEGTDAREVVSSDTGERLQDRLDTIDEIETQIDFLRHGYGQVVDLRISDFRVGDDEHFANIINAMRGRNAANPVDKVFGIATVSFRPKAHVTRHKCREPSNFGTWSQVTMASGAFRGPFIPKLGNPKPYVTLIGTRFGVVSLVSHAKILVTVTPL